MRPTIAFINESTVLTDTQIANAIPDYQTYLSRDIASVWGPAVDADLIFVPKGGIVPAGAWQMGIFNDSDQAGALGYHQLTAAGKPIGFVFAKTDMIYGADVFGTMAHELAEMVCDPTIDRTLQVRDLDGHVWEYAIEVADPPEADQFNYTVGKTACSDFVTPAWFDPLYAGTEVNMFDFCGKIEKALEILEGGYISRRPADGSGPWAQVNGRLVPSHKENGSIHTRRHRRAIPHHYRTPSRPTELSSVTHTD